MTRAPQPYREQALTAWELINALVRLVSMMECHSSSEYASGCRHEFLLEYWQAREAHLKHPRLAQIQAAQADLIRHRRVIKGNIG